MFDSHWAGYVRRQPGSARLWREADAETSSFTLPGAVSSDGITAALGPARGANLVHVFIVQVVPALRAAGGLDDPSRSMLRSISSTHSSVLPPAQSLLDYLRSEERRFFLPCPIHRT